MRSILPCESCLAELHRNPLFYRLLGIDSVAGIPKPWNVSRFLEALGREPHLTELRKVFEADPGQEGPLPAARGPRRGRHGLLPRQAQRPARAK